MHIIIRQLDYIRTTKNACTVPTQNGYAELRKVMRIYNSTSELSADARIALAIKETGFAEKKATELVALGKACEYPIGIFLKRTAANVKLKTPPNAMARS